MDDAKRKLFEDIRRLYTDSWDSVTRGYEKKKWILFDLILQEAGNRFAGLSSPESMYAHITRFLMVNGLMEKNQSYEDTVLVVSRLADELRRVALKNGKSNGLRWNTIIAFLTKAGLYC